MSEKVLGLKFKSSRLYKDVKYTFSENEVPVVSLQEHNKEIEKLRKHLDAVIALYEKKLKKQGSEKKDG